MSEETLSQSLFEAYAFGRVFAAAVLASDDTLLLLVVDVVALSDPTSAAAVVEEDSFPKAFSTGAVLAGLGGRGPLVQSSVGHWASSVFTSVISIWVWDVLGVCECVGVWVCECVG